MRSHLEDVPLSGLSSVFDVLDLLSNLDEGITEAVDLGFALRLRRFDHQRVGDRPGHGRSVESVVL